MHIGLRLSIERYMEYKLNSQILEVYNREIVLMLTLCTYVYRTETGILPSVNLYAGQGLN